MARATSSSAGQTAQTSGRRRRKPRGALAAICALLVTSALLRMAIGAGEALAREDGPGGASPLPVAQVPDGRAVPVEQEDKHAGGYPEAPLMVAEADFQPLLDALNAREARLREREKAFEVRMQALSVAETEIDRRMTAMAEAEASLKETLTLARTAAAEDVARLTDVYANMKPKKAAALFEEMDPEFAAGFLGRMRPNAAAAIMADMSPEKAYLTSVILAGRNADVPKE